MGISVFISGAMKRHGWLALVVTFVLTGCGGGGDAGNTVGGGATVTSSDPANSTATDNAGTTTSANSDTPPATGSGDTSPPPGGGDASPPAGGNDTPPPAGGGDTTPPPAGGGDTPPATGGDVTPPPPSGPTYGHCPPFNIGDQTVFFSTMMFSGIAGSETVTSTVTQNDGSIVTVERVTASATATQTETVTYQIANGAVFEKEIRIGDVITTNTPPLPACAGAEAGFTSTFESRNSGNVIASGSYTLVSVGSATQSVTVGAGTFEATKYVWGRVRKAQNGDVVNSSTETRYYADNIGIVKLGVTTTSTFGGFGSLASELASKNF